MIRRSPMAKAASLLTSVLIVGGGIWMAAPDLSVEVEGAGEAVDARLGTSFEDMVKGMLEAEKIEDVTPEETRAEVVDALTQSQDVPQTEPVAAAPAEARPQPMHTPPVQVEASMEPVMPRNVEMSIAQPGLTVPVGPDAVLSAAPVEAPSTLEAPPVTQATLLATRTTAATSVKTLSQVAAPVSPMMETLSAQTPASAAPPQSMRPKRKDPGQAAKFAAARPKPEVAKAATKPKVSRGNAQRNNTQGAQNGTRTQAKTAKQGTTQKASAQAGNAAVSNYPGQVMRRISRVPKPRINSRGTTVVAFSISSGGGLAGVAVARSSGSAALDQAAVRVIRKAAPFPKPPRGARRQFSIRIKGR